MGELHGRGAVAMAIGVFVAVLIADHVGSQRNFFTFYMSTNILLLPYHNYQL